MASKLPPRPKGTPAGLRTKPTLPRPPSKAAQARQDAIAKGTAHPPTKSKNGDKRILTPDEIELALTALASEQLSETKLAARYGMSRYRLAMQLQATPELSRRYALARVERAHNLAEEVVEIADATKPEKGAVQLAKLRIETRLKMAACYHPDAYGARINTKMDASQEYLEAFRNAVAGLSKVPPEFTPQAPT